MDAVNVHGIGCSGKAELRRSLGIKERVRHAPTSVQYILTIKFGCEICPNHSEGNAARCSRFPVLTLSDPAEATGETSWLPNSHPNPRAIVAARGRETLSKPRPTSTFPELAKADRRGTGAGDMSIAFGDAAKPPVGREVESSGSAWAGDAGGEFKDMVDANDNSRSTSDERNSSISFGGRKRRSLGFRDGAGGG